MNTSKEPYDKITYFALALDPIHVGTGSYRLGRVDLSIVREPGTNVPKIPGTSLTGACRTYAAMTIRDNRKEKAHLHPIWPNCAGQGQPDTGRGYQGHCGQLDCPICVTFGFARPYKSFQGLSQFSDAHLVLFPVHSLAGPVWVTCPDVLTEFNIHEGEPPDGQVRVAKGVKMKEKLNLGWLMLAKDAQPFFLDEKLNAVPQEIRSRAVLVPNKLFGQIVNDNLEVRTSVSIDPSTGAAAEKALFTYEALPQASVLAFEVVISNPKFYLIDGQEPLKNQGGKNKVRQAVEDGLKFFEVLGIGGMSTRGMGRLRILNLQSSVNQPKGGAS